MQRCVRFDHMPAMHYISGDSSYHDYRDQHPHKIRAQDYCCYLSTFRGFFSIRFHSTLLRPHEAAGDPSHFTSILVLFQDKRFGANSDTARFANDLVRRPAAGFADPPGISPRKDCSSDLRHHFTSC